MAPRKNTRSDSTSDSGPDDAEPKPAQKKAKTSTSKDNDEEDSWQLDSRRFLKLREYKGKWMVDIREYYESDGLKPGKKGISLSLAQWRKLSDAVDEINNAIKERV